MSADLAGSYEYSRVGHDSRRIELLSDGSIGEGKARLEKRWDVADGKIRIHGDAGCIVELLCGEDGTWRGKWTKFERMPIHMRRTEGAPVWTRKPVEKQVDAPRPIQVRVAQVRAPSPEPVHDTLVDISKLRVAAVFGTYNRFEMLKDAVASIRSAKGRMIVDMVIVDGGSTDGSREWLAAQEDVILIGQRGRLTGAVRAFNLGFGYAVDHAYDFVFHFNDDAAIEASSGQALERAAEILLADPTIGEVAFEFDLRGGWGFEPLHDGIYANFGMVRLDVGTAVAKAQGDASGRAWWSTKYHTYAADCEFGCWTRKLGWKIHPGVGLRVHDRNAKDSMRSGNEANDTARHGFWERWADPKSILPYAKRDWVGAKIHLGCGTKRLHGWVNVDGSPGPAVDVVSDFEALFSGVPSGVVDLVYWAHGPEHIYPDRLPILLKEIRRVLSPNGTLLTAAPSFVGIYKNRFESSVNGSAWNSALYGECDSTDNPMLAHRQCFTFESLSSLLSVAGFCDVGEWSTSNHPEIASLGDYTVTCAAVTVCVSGRVRPSAVATGGIALCPAPGAKPSCVAPRKSERVLHVALRGPAEGQPGLDRALRSISTEYRDVDWASLEPNGQMVSAILSAAREIKPTVVFMQLQRDTDVKPETVRRLRALCGADAVILDWHGDKLFEPPSKDLEWFVRLGAECDSTLVTNTSELEEYARLGVRRPGYLQIGIDGEIYFPHGTSDVATGKVVFMGSNYPHLACYKRRLAVLEALRSNVNLAVFGHGWGKLGHRLLSQPEEAPAYASSAAAVAMSNGCHLSRYTSDRLLRALGSGALVVAERFHDCETLGATDGETCVTWSGGPEEAVRAVRKALAMPADRQAQMRAAAAKVVAAEHTWDYRMGELLAIVHLVRSMRWDGK